MGSHPYLACAAKMRDQGVDDVRVTDSAGRPIPETGTRKAWSTGGDGLVIKRRRMDGR